MPSSACLAALPNELILEIFTCLPSQNLMQLALVSRHFHYLVIRILEHRLALAATLRDLQLLLECYPPSKKFSQKALNCRYLGTDGLNSTEDLSHKRDEKPPGVRLGELNKLYTRFKPYRIDPQGDLKPSRHPAGDVLGSRTHPGTGQQLDTPSRERSLAIPAASAPENGRTSPSPNQSPAQEVHEILGEHEIYLDSFELFTQLQATATLVKPGPRLEFYSCAQRVSKGVVRVWRDWLADTHLECEAAQTKPRDSIPGSRSQEILLVNDGTKVGLRLRVERQFSRPNPHPSDQYGEDEAVCYKIMFEELHIPTSHLLLMTEKALYKGNSSFGKAVVFGVTESAVSVSF